MKVDLNEVCAALAFAKPLALAHKGGFIAMIELNVERFSDEQRSILLTCLTGYLDSQRPYFMSPVADNQERPILFKCEEKALQEAQLRANGLPPQFIYGAFCEYGQVVKYQQAQQVFFRPRQQLK
jgi:hypothetical protein